MVDVLLLFHVVLIKPMGTAKGKKNHHQIPEFLLFEHTAETH